MNVQAATLAATALNREMNARNISSGKLPWVMQQAAGETSGFTSAEYTEDNNLSGIKWFGQALATQGRPVPNSEFKPGKKYGNHYAHYASIELWAKDYLNTLQKHGNPLQANNIEEFAAILKENGYYQATEADYLKMLKSWAETFKKHLSSFADDHGGIVGLVCILVLIFVTYKLLA
jgi:hypothetical protein